MPVNIKPVKAYVGRLDRFIFNRVIALRNGEKDCGATNTSLGLGVHDGEQSIIRQISGCLRALNTNGCVWVETIPWLQTISDSPVVKGIHEIVRDSMNTF